MGAVAISRWVSLALKWVPAPLHRALDTWSQRQARRRRLQRVRLAAERHAR